VKIGKGGGGGRGKERRSEFEDREGVERRKRREGEEEEEGKGGEGWRGRREEVEKGRGEGGRGGGGKEEEGRVIVERECGWALFIAGDLRVGEGCGIEVITSDSNGGRSFLLGVGKYHDPWSGFWYVPLPLWVV
jgi:hypothetical protein